MKNAAFVFSLLLSCTSLNAQAEIYQWTDRYGNTHLSDVKPEDGKAKNLKLVDPNPKPVNQSINLTGKIKPNQAIKPPKLVLYTADWCKQCREARAYLDHNKIAYTDYNVETSSKGAADYKRMGNKARLPVVILNGRTSSGFNVKGFEQKWQQALIVNASN